MSPIIGLTDQVVPRFPRLGKLRKGGPSVEKTSSKGNKYNSYGADLEYFRFTAENPAIAEAFQAAFGEKPALLKVYLPYATTEQNFDTWREKWDAGGMLHRCDGETMTIWREAKKTVYHREPKKCDGGCKEVGRLVMIIPELFQAGFVGYVTLETHSKHDLMNITAALKATEEAMRGNPLGLRGILFTLRRTPEKISTPSEEGRATRQKWLVSLAPAPDWVQLQLQLASQQQNAPLQLEAPRATVIDGVTGEIIEPPEDDEDDEEEPAEPPMPEPAEAKPPSGNGRPNTAAQIKAAIEEYIIAHPSDDEPSENQLTLYRALLSKVIPDEQRRHTFQFEVVGVLSSVDLKLCQVRAILGWLKPVKDDKGKYSVGNPYALAEANAVINAAVQRQAVGELPGMPEPEREEIPF